MLTIKHLSKRYSNGVQALDNISLTINKGMFGLSGPNGAGKSSLMRSLATLQKPDSGSIFFDGIDLVAHPQEIKKRLGYLPQEFGVYPRVSAYQLLDYLAIMKGISNRKARKEQVLALLAQTNLYEHKDNHVATFSGGMKRRFGIAQALLGDPKLIMVDEPTAGLDPEERNRFYNLLSEVSKDIILILSTHIIEDIQALCSDMAIMNQGKILAQGSPNTLTNGLHDKIWFKSFNDKAELEGIQGHILSTRNVGPNKIVHVYAKEQPSCDFKQGQPCLEDAYFHLLNINS